MKKFLTLLILGMLFASACQLFSGPNLETPSTPPTPTPTNPPPFKPSLTSGEDVSEYFREGLIESQQSALDQFSNASFYNIAFTIQDDIYHVEGVEEVHYTNREDVTLDEILIRLLPNALSGEMNAISVKVNGQPFEPIYELQDSAMRVPLYQSLEPGESVDLTINFSVTVPTSIETNYGILAYYDNVLTLAHSYPMIAVYDDEGWNAEIPPNQGDPVYADASFFLVTVDAPKDLVLVASGIEVDRQDNGSRQIVKYAAGPARDFYLAASPDYAVITETIGGVTFNSYAPADMEDGAQWALDIAARAFAFYDDQFTPYPYTEFDIISSPTYALGIEYPGLIAITDRIYDLNSTLYNTPNTGMMEGTVAHEAAHQWFYNLVGNDQLDEPWLDESLAQFITWQYYANQYGSNGASGFESSLQGRWDGASDKNIPIGLPVEDYQGSDYSAIIYGRGAFFFQALREKMGESNFDKFMKDYVMINSWGIGTGDGLKKLAEKHCQCNLDRIFRNWVTP